MPSQCCAFMLCVRRNLLAADALFLLGSICADPGEGRRDGEGKLAVDGGELPVAAKGEGWKINRRCSHVQLHLLSCN